MAAVIVIGCARAEAAVYTFTPMAIGVSPAPFTYTLQDATFTLAISDAAVQAGAFTYDYRYRLVDSGNPPRITMQPSAVGDVQALQLFQTDNGAISFGSGDGPAGTSSDFLRIDLGFSSTGAVIFGTVEYNTDAYSLDLAGTGRIFGGRFGIGNLQRDSVIGSLTGNLSTPDSVPEPMTLGMLGLAFAVVVRSRRQTVMLIKASD